MARCIVKQPNGFYAVWSSIVEDFIFYDCTPEEIIEEYIKEQSEDIKKWVPEFIKKLDDGKKPFGNRTMTWEKALEQRKWNHPDRKDTDFELRDPDVEGGQ